MAAVKNSELEKIRSIHLQAVFPKIKERGPNGERYCRRCRGVVPKGRLMWCGEKCIIEAGAICGQMWAIRQGLKERDGGKCAWCGFNFEELEKMWRYGTEWAQGDIDRVIKNLKEAGFDTSRYLWEAHHVIRVIDGGARLGLPNLITLCQHCHKWLHHNEALKRRKNKYFEFEEEISVPGAEIFYLIDGAWKNKGCQQGLTF